MFKSTDWDLSYICQGQSTHVLVIPWKKTWVCPRTQFIYYNIKVVIPCNVDYRHRYPASRGTFGYCPFRFDIHSKITRKLELVCNALPFFNAFTGSDITSQFAGRGKKTAWRTWQALPDTTATFIRLSSLIDMSETDKLVLERFVQHLQMLMIVEGTCSQRCRDQLKTAHLLQMCWKIMLKGLNCNPRYGLPGLISDSESIDPLKWGWQKKPVVHLTEAHVLVVRMDLVVLSFVCAMDYVNPFDIIF